MSLLTDEEVKEIRLSAPAVCHHADLIRHTEKFIEAKTAQEIEQLREQVSAQQAEIDRLMLEYCPDEMTQEQFEEWAAHQKPVDDPLFDLHTQLASSQLHVQKLRKALEDCRPVMDAHCFAPDQYIAFVKALATPSSTEALDAYVAEQAKKWREAYESAAEAAMKLGFKIEDLTRQRDLAVEALIHIQQVACSGSPELGISADALSAIKETNES